MNSKNILLFLVLFIISNAYTLVIGEEEEDIPSSTDKFRELEITATASPKILPTGTKTVPIVSSSKSIPVQTNVEPVEMKETVVTLGHWPLFNTFDIISTVLPTDVDDIYAPCSYIVTTKAFVEPTPSPYVCNVLNEKNCYTFYENFNYTTTYEYYYSDRTIIDEYNCNIYTRKSSDPTPTATESIEMTSICTPTNTYTEIDTYYMEKTRTESTIFDENNTDIETLVRTVIESKGSRVYVRSSKTVCYTATSTTDLTYTITHTPYIYPEYNDKFIEKNKFIYENYRYGFVSTPMTIPDSVEQYAVDCEFNFKYAKPYTLMRRGLSSKTVSSSPKTIPSSSTITSSSKSLKTIPTQNTKYPSYIVIYPSKEVPKTMAKIDNYCESDDYCFNKYTEITTSYSTAYSTTYATCAFYTHKKDEPVYSTAIRTSLCKPTSSAYLSKTKLYLSNYGTFYKNGDLLTTVEYLVKSKKYITTSTTYCQQNDEVVTATASTTIQSSKVVPSSSSSVAITTQSTKSSKTIPSSSKTIPSSSKTIPSSSKTIPSSSKTIPSSSSSVDINTQTTKTIPSGSSTKCIPITVTVTEKEKVTVKQTVTVTVAGDKINSISCAKKWAQCGGQDFNGPNCCEAGSSCHEVNKYYSQCI